MCPIKPVPFLSAVLALASILSAGTLSARAAEDTAADRFARGYALLRAAGEAGQAGNTAAALTALEEAARLRPDHGGILLNLANTRAGAGDTDGALAALADFARLGLTFDTARAPGLHALVQEGRGREIAAALTQNASPVTTAEPAFTLPGGPRLAEALAHDPVTRRSFLSTVAPAGVLVRYPDGRVEPFGPALTDSAFGMEIDRENGQLWVGIATLEQTPGATADTMGRSGLLALDLSNGREMRRVMLPPDGKAHVLGDMATSRDGAVWATDSAAGALYVLRPGADILELVHTGLPLRSPQGITAAPDGSGRLVLADYSTGLHAVDPATGAITPLETPEGRTLLGIDGLERWGDRLVAIQNGTTPHRVLALSVDLDGARVTEVTVLDRARLDFAEPTNGTATPDGFLYIATSRWPSFGPGGVAASDTPDDTLILRLAD